MNAAQQHLLLNHLPVIGSLFCLLLLAYGLARRSAEVQKAALGALVVVALLAVPTYLTGEPAEEIIEKQPGYSHSYVEPHESMAKMALIASLMLGVLALGGLLFSRGRAVPTGLAMLVLLGNLAVFGLMAYTAHLGGQIRHSEIRGEPPPFGAPGEAGEHQEHE
ncbi:hypothetical protein HRbin15_01979 [bacterium HR15]|nr:hypothetical protein HRbin15_01979 [bacterium HR15]